jgi:dihydrolipoamide dehydrogenase
MAKSPDIVIIGAGPGGYVAAIRAAQLGLNVTIVERSHLGGICLNWGCIPTKALLTTGEVFGLLSQLKAYGVNAEAASFDLLQLVKRSRGIAQQLSSGVGFLMKKNNIDVIEGTARLEPGLVAPIVIVENDNAPLQELAADAVILATGARPKTLPSIGLSPDHERVWTYREAMVPDHIPKSLLIIGAGAIGIEFASFYRAMGAEVIVVEALERILPNEDADISIAAKKALEKRGIRFLTATKVRGSELQGDGISLQLESGEHGSQCSQSAEVALLAVGVVANIDNIGLGEVGVETKANQIVVDPTGATNVAGLYAIGDIAGAPWLAHKASHEGVRCVEHIAGRAVPIVHSPVPACTYSDPQVASVGLTEAQAREKYSSIDIGRFPFRFNGRALSAGYTEGFCKTIFDNATGKLLGAHLIGSEVTELIHSLVLAMTLGATRDMLSHVMFPHPTLSEVLHESSLASAGIPLHM